VRIGHKDLFEPEAFVAIVNEAYELPGATRLTVETLDEADKTTGRLVKKAEAAFKVMPEPSPTYDHFTPAAWLIRNPQALDGIATAIETTLGRAEKLFETLNGVLR
jgi:hypothetical protein